MDYTPRPIDTSRVKQSPQLAELTERLARNTHEHWAKQRIADGWTLGAERNDSRKQHPCLVPYDQLPESEKQYDRLTAVGTLNAIQALGYAISPPESELPGGKGEPQGGDDALEAMLELLRDPHGVDLEFLLALWNGIQDEWRSNRELHQLLAQGFAALGEPLSAYDVADAGHSRWPGDVRLRQLMALALARSGASDRAKDVLNELIEEGNRDAETLGLYARTLKDLWQSEPDQNLGDELLKDACKAYETAYDETDSFWTGVNAATLARLADEHARALEIAARVGDQCSEDLRRASDAHEDTYWHLATLGEVALIQSDVEGAVRHYADAARIGKSRLGDLQSTRRNARLLAEYSGMDWDAIGRCFSIPPVTAFIVERQSPLSVPRRAPELADADRKQLHAIAGQMTYVSVQSEFDADLAVELARRAGETYVVIPHEGVFGVGGNIEPMPCLNHHGLEAATAVIPASHRPLPSSIVDSYTAAMLRGLAGLRARQLETQLRFVLVGQAEGGSVRVRTVDASTADELTYSPGEIGAADNLDDGDSRDPGQHPVDIMSYLFADAVGFSKLGDEQIPPFVDRFLGLVADALASEHLSPVAKNTWGDGLHVVFSDAQEAAAFALTLRDGVDDTDWEQIGLPENFGLRIALHAGPAYRCTDPVTEKTGYFGSHVSHAARIEPITPPGEVYASQAFAALLAASECNDIDCVYVGSTEWAKGYGTFATYHVRRGAR